MKTLVNKSALLINFVMPAMLLNSIGVVILMLHSQGVALESIGWLQPFKDGAVLIGSILLISFITKFGYKLAIRIGCVIQFAACLLLGFSPSLENAYVFFIMAGVSFALLKISIYSSVTAIVKGSDAHAGMISLLEGGFMIAIFIANGLFAWMIHIGAWHNTFFIFAGFICIAFIASFGLNMKSSAHHDENISDNYKKLLKLLTKPLVWLFLLLTIAYPFIEQGFIDFLPTFQSSVLNVSHSKSVLIAAMLPAMIAAGRVIYSFVVKYIHVKTALFSSVILAIITMSTALISAHFAGESETMGLVAMWLLPAMGLFIAPIYPTLNSAMLSNESEGNQSAMTLIIMIFSAIGASIGSVLTGYLFGYFGGINAFAIYIVMLIFILMLLIPFFMMIKIKQGAER